MLPTVEALAADLAAGRTNSVELTTAALARAADPAGEGARVFTRLDAERALALARASDALRRIGPARSPLDGMPVSMKDLFDIAGETTRAGSERAARRAACGARCDRGGAAAGPPAPSSIGRTNMTEFAYSGLGHQPALRHAAQRLGPRGGRIPGGSSSGAAVSVTDGMAVGAHRHRHRRLGAHPCRAVRPGGLQADRAPRAARWRAAAVDLARLRRAAGRTRSRCCAMDAVLAGEPVAVPTAADLVDAAWPSRTRSCSTTLTRTWQLPSKPRLACWRRRARASAASPFPSVPMPALHARGAFTAAEAWAWHRRQLESRRRPTIRASCRASGWAPG